MTDLIRNPNTVVIINATGAIGAGVVELPTCDARITEELFWFSNGEGGMDLLRHYLKWVNEQERIDVDFFNSLDKRVTRVMPRYGFTPVETKLARYR